MTPECFAGVDAFRTLIKSGEARRIIFVGHESDLSTAMLALTKMSADGPIELKKGGCYGLRTFDDAARAWSGCCRRAFCVGGNRRVTSSFSSSLRPSFSALRPFVLFLPVCE